MSIYTKRGDHGKTGFYKSKRRVYKDNQRITVLGSIDELNAQLGLAKSLIRDTDTDTDQVVKILNTVQQDLFEIAAEIASENPKHSPFHCKPEKVKRLETLIDKLEKELPQLSNFIFPGGCPRGAGLHVARSVCRRTEREAVRFARSQKVNPEIFKYLNRLSDALFVLARWVNKIDGIPEEEWNKSK
ncbi:MAG: cob(I)yrinic acid a,c-diamide adenosyltransferase [Candidatus Blackburnbacteria bacterium]|nr:cob(I)yrinic acid a,c-diamide adenosyltransferase [Candidatus Blackburnbacteria bacterium]